MDQKREWSRVSKCIKSTTGPQSKQGTRIHQHSGELLSFFVISNKFKHVCILWLSILFCVGSGWMEIGYIDVPNGLFNFLVGLLCVSYMILVSSPASFVLVNFTFIWWWRLYVVNWWWLPGRKRGVYNFSILLGFDTARRLLKIS